MESGDYDANIARYCLVNYHRFPHEYMQCSRRERALIGAIVHEEVEMQKKEATKMKKK